MTQEESLSTIQRIEDEIDLAFANSRLLDLGYAQAVWTLLSQNEDAYMRAIHELSNPYLLDMFIDLRMNALTYPLRVCHQRLSRGASELTVQFVDDHYKLAMEWLELACHGYYSYCAIFPLWRRGLVRITLLQDGRLAASYISERNRAYEVYNRLVAKEGRRESTDPLPTDVIAQDVLANTTRGADWFRVNFDPRLVRKLVSGIEPLMGPRHLLPANWKFSGFALGEFKQIFITVQAMLWGWLIARNVLAGRGMPGLAYKSSVWVVGITELRARLRRYTGIDSLTIDRVLELLTFGSCDVREPDVAVQPLIDLGSGDCALAPFVWLNAHAERNLCVLMNQIPAQREIYERLKNEKEALLQQELEAFLSGLGLQARRGEVDGTNVDIGIVDTAEKVCLCLELKWFIEPAEVREGHERTQELIRGVEQAKKIRSLFSSGDTRLIRDILQIDSSYTFAVAVGSVNWIGHADAQDNEVPIVKVWHLMHRIRDGGSLHGAINWLAKREYLPVEGTDFEIEPVDIACGKWACGWYLIKPVGPNAND
jgi:hypothetical protein